MPDFLRGKKPLFLIALCAAFLCGAGSFLFRDFWFDEVLTIDLVYACRDSMLRLFASYQVPNNHIVFSLILQQWVNLLESLASSAYPALLIRLPSLLAALISLLILWRVEGRRCRWAFTFPVLLLLGISVTFCLYATAVRGYMTGFLLGLCGFLAAERWMRRGRLRNLVFYALCAFLAMGTAPTNLAVFAGIVLLCPSREHSWRVLALALIPPAALVLFYLPIFPMLLHCMSLGEGWASRSGAALNLVCALLLMFLPVLPFALAGAWRLVRRDGMACLIPALGIAAVFLLPLGPVLLFPHVPFPRVFFPMTALWVILICRGVRFFFRDRPASSPRCLILLYALSFVWGVVQFYSAPLLSSAVFGTAPDADDLIAPRYVRPAFQPSRTAQFLIRILESDPEVRIYATFDSDPPSLAFALRREILSKNRAFPAHFYYDTTLPHFRTDSLDSAETWYFVAMDASDLERYREKFHFRLTELVFSNGMQSVFRIQK